MNEVGIWHVLGIEPIDDKRLIKEAYLSKLAIFHPEEDPAGFQRLHEAYSEAKKYKPIANKAPVQHGLYWDEDEDYDDEGHSPLDNAARESVIPSRVEVLSEPVAPDETPSFARVMSKKISSEDEVPCDTDADGEVMHFTKQRDLDVAQLNAWLQAKEFEKVVNFCDVCLVKYRDSFFFYETKIKALLELNAQEEALSTCVEVLSIHPKEIELHLTKLRLEMSLKLYADANATASVILSSKSDCFEAYESRFTLFRESENDQGMIKVYEALKEIKTTPDVFFSVENDIVYMTAIGRSGRYQEAADAFNALLAQLDKHKDKALFDQVSVLRFEMQGRAFLEKKSYRLAQISLGSGLARDKENEAILYELVRLHLDRKQHSIARGYIETLISKKPTTSRLHEMRARALRQEELYAEALVSAAEAVRLAPQSTDYLTLLGALHDDMGDFNKAATCFEKAIALNPYDVNVQFLLSSALKKTKDYVKCEESLRKVIELAGPDDRHLYLAWHEIGDICCEQYRLQEAIEALENCERYRHTIDVDASWHLYILAKCYRLVCEYEKALDAVKRITKIDVSEYYLIAQILGEDLGETQKALEYVETALTRKSRIPRDRLHCHYLLRGKLYEKLNIEKKAVLNFEKALDLMKVGLIFKKVVARSRSHCFFLGEVYSCLKNFSESEKYYRLAFEFIEQGLGNENITPVMIHLGLAEMFARKGDTRKAIEAYTYIHEIAKCEKYARRLQQLEASL